MCAAVAVATRRQAVGPGGSRLRVTCCDVIIVSIVIGSLLFRYMNPSEVPKKEPEEDPYYRSINTRKARIKEIGRKVEDGLSSMRKDFDEKMKMKEHEIDMRLKALDARSDVYMKFMDGFGNKGFLTKEEFGDFFEDFMKSKENDDNESSKISLDEILAYAMRFVQEEIERHASDGLGMVDYALASGGGKVMSHSEPYGGDGRGSWLGSRNRVSADAEKMISPSFGESGQCFRLKGESGFVEIRIGAAIVLEAVTLEHVAKNVAYDRLDAPKHCRIFGWMDGQDSTHKKFMLCEFTYDLEKSNVQTVMVKEPAASVDTIRFEFQSNHGRASHTCIYRLRVHGHQLNASSLIEQ